MPIVTSSSSTEILVSNTILQLRKRGLLGERADARNGAGNMEDEMNLKHLRVPESELMLGKTKTKKHHGQKVCQRDIGATGKKNRKQKTSQWPKLEHLSDKIN